MRVLVLLLIFCSTQAMAGFCASDCSHHSAEKVTENVKNSTDCHNSSEPADEPLNQNTADCCSVDSSIVDKSRPEIYSTNNKLLKFAKSIASTKTLTLTLLEFKTVKPANKFVSNRSFFNVPLFIRFQNLKIPNVLLS